MKTFTKRDLLKALDALNDDAEIFVNEGEERAESFGCGIFADQENNGKLALEIFV